MQPLRPPTTSSLGPRGVLVWLLATLVFALGLLHAAPTLHEHLHGNDPDHAVVHDDAGCAVTLFAHGVTPSQDLPRITAPRIAAIAVFASARSDVNLTAAQHLQPPGRGPPRIG